MDADPKPAGLMASLGLDRIIDEGANGRAILQFRATMDMCHSGGIVQGGFVTGWLDSAMAHAVIAASNHEVSPLSLEIKVAFYASARPGLCIAEAWIDRRGKSTAFLEGVLKDEAGTILAKATSTAKLVPIKRG
jgi:uncharacterized protein (TIGR00369 family)